MESVCVVASEILSLVWMDLDEMASDDGWQWMKAYECMRSLQLLLKTHLCSIQGVVVLFNLSFYAAAQVSPLTPAWFINLGILYEDFHMNSLRVSPVGRHCWLRTNMFFAYFHLIFVYLSGEQVVVRSSIYLRIRKYFELMLEEHSYGFVCVEEA